MHNSGTSLLGNLMHGAGVPMGPSLLMKQTIPKERRPRYDYFEDAEIVKIQDLALLGMKRHWSSYKASFSLPPSEHPARVKFRKELTRLLAIRFKKNSLWLVKDPRSSVLVEDWLNILAKLELDTRLLIVHRDPRSNIRSFDMHGRQGDEHMDSMYGTFSDLADVSPSVSDFVPEIDNRTSLYPIFSQ